MEITEDDYKELIGFIGWLTAIKKYDNLPPYIDFLELKKMFMLQNCLNGYTNHTEVELKEMINTLVRKKLIAFKKENDMVFLKLI